MQMVYLMVTITIENRIPVDVGILQGVDCPKDVWNQGVTIAYERSKYSGMWQQCYPQWFRGQCS